MASDSLRDAPVLKTDRKVVRDRTCYDFRDYGFVVSSTAVSVFEVVATRADDEEAFLFFFNRDDLVSDHWALMNLHVFLKRTEPLADFAHTLGPSVATIPLQPVTVFGKPGLGYSREIAMQDLFMGAPEVIKFIGGAPEMIVRDSHYYFRHRHAHAYSGLLHPPGAEQRYDALRQVLFSSVEFIP